MWHLCRLQTIISAPCMGGSSRELSDAVGTAIPFLWCASPRELQTCAHQCASLTLTLQVCPIPGENTGSHNESAVNPTVDSERPWEPSPMLHPQPLLPWGARGAGAAPRGCQRFWWITGDPMYKGEKGNYHVFRRLHRIYDNNPDKTCMFSAPIFGSRIHWLIANYFIP
ncbi:uncharacterized protein [Taeniopygia guttata]|uniref:uncharacterized protein isoform X2 n=1 Tax=Taeniopygia guttata TaxID=59729 RepID=UPI003BB9898B